MNDSDKIQVDKKLYGVNNEIYTIQSIDDEQIIIKYLKELQITYNSGNDKKTIIKEEDLYFTYKDIGIKLFFKIDDCNKPIKALYEDADYSNYTENLKNREKIEEEIEKVLDSGKIDELTAKPNKIGVSEDRKDLLDEYLYFFRKNFEDDFDKLDKDNFTVAIDTANGATSVIADKVYTALGIKHYIINNTPNGININDNCGSTHLEMLKKYVKDNKFDLGSAYDGDGDRCLGVDRNGEVIDGDIILAITSKYLKSKGELKNDAVVATVMSNLGLRKYCKENDIKFVQTQVGDRYVLENMLKNDYNLGGEQSGHIIFLDYNPTGDGILTSLMLIKIILESKKDVTELKKIIKIYPQVLINAKVSSDKKYDFDKDEEIVKRINKLNDEFKENGRVLIRASGTEPLVRVMIEGEDQDYITKKAEELAKFIEERLK